MAVRAFIEFLAKKGDPKAVERTIGELIYFNRSPMGAKELHELLQKKGTQKLLKESSEAFLKEDMVMKRIR